MRRLGTLTAIVAFVVAFALAFAAAPKVAQAVHLSCGDTITGNTTLDESLDCTGGGGSGLIIGANGTTLNLKGFVLKGDPSDPASFGVDNTGGFKGVRIKNGVIEGFEQGVRAVGAKGLRLRNLTFTGQTSGNAVSVIGGKNVTIKNSSFTIPVTSFLGPEAMHLESVDGVKVRNVDVHGGFVGVNFACPSPCDGSDPPTNGEVKNSVFHGTFIGVFLANTTKARVKRNHISGGVKVTIPSGPTLDSKGILAQVDPLTPLTPAGSTNVSGVKIERNHIHDNDGFGIKLDGVTDSVVKRNKVHVNTEDGIALVSVIFPGPTTVGSTGNVIKRNTSTGNGGVDLFHDVASTPNTWKNNQCVTKSGGDIPSC